MQISDILSDKQLTALCTTPTSTRRKYTHTPSWAHDYALECIAPSTKRGLSENFWANFDDAFQGCKSVVVIIDKNRICAKGVLRNKIYARHIVHEIKSGKQVYWIELENCFQVKPCNLPSVWAYLTQTTKRNYEYDEYDVAAERLAKIDAKREKMFYEAAKANRYSKIGKRGFNTSFDELRAFMRHDAYERELRGVVENAREIFGVL